MPHRTRILELKRRLDEIGRHLDDLEVRDPAGYRRIEREDLGRLERDAAIAESRAGFAVAGSRVPEKGMPRLIQRIERRP